MEENLAIYPEDIVALAKNTKHFGRMNPALARKGGVNDPTGAAFVKGPCGDEMEFYLIIKDGIIEEAKFYTKGCISTLVCGEVTAELARSKSIDDALGISPKRIKEILKGLPETHSHCSILAVSTLHRAVADYLLKK